MRRHQPSMSTCAHCGTFFVAADAEDLASIESAHRCAAMIDRNVTQAFGFQKESALLYSLFNACPDCHAQFSADTYGDLRRLWLEHTCPAREVRQMAQDTDRWRDLVTVEDARFLKAMRIDPL